MLTRMSDVAARYPANLATIDLFGQVVHEPKPELNAPFDEAMTGGSSLVLLNFLDGDHISSTGIKIIVGVLARKTGRRIAACQVTSARSSRSRGWSTRRRCVRMN